MVDGYSDKQHVLLEKLLEKLSCFEVDKKRFDILLESVKIIHLLIFYIRNVIM